MRSFLQNSTGQHDFSQLHNARIIYLCDGDSDALFVEALSEAGMTTDDVAAGRAADRIVTIPAMEFYTRGQSFDPDPVIAVLKQLEQETQMQGLSGLLLICEMGWALDDISGTDRLIEFESKVSEHVCCSNSQAFTLCMYDCNRFHPSTLLNVISTHPVIHVGDGQFDNMYFIPPSQFSQHPDDLAQHIFSNRIRNLVEQKFTTDVLQRQGRQIKEMDCVLQREAEERHSVEALNKAKSLLMASLSHEIRTPLVGVIGTLSLLTTDQHLTEQQRSLVDIVHYSTNHLLSVIDDVLLFTKFEVGGKVVLESRPFDLRALVHSAIVLFRQAALEHKIQLSYVVKENVPALPLLGDTTRIRQVIFNVLSNAIKFTKDGGAINVVVSCVPRDVSEEAVSTDSSEESDSDIIFAISDTGIGIPREKHEEIFHSFAQLDNGLEKNSSGTGLGLAVCKKLVSLWGGRIWLNSEIGAGTTFYFTIPLRIAKCRDHTGSYVSLRNPVQSCPEAAHATAAQSAKTALNVLVADDDPIARKVMCHMLERLGHKVTAVADGLSALAAVEQRLSGDHGEQFDIAFIDLVMPHLNGFETSEAIHKLNWEADSLSNTKRKKPYLVALSATLDNDCQNKCLDAGLDHCLVKPLCLPQVQQLIGEISSTLSGHPSK